MNYKIIHKAVVRAVRRCKEKHHGGPEFHEAMDRWIEGTYHFLDITFWLLNEPLRPEKHYDHSIVVSGGFGRAFANIMQSLGITFNTLLVLEGDLRGGHIPDLSYLNKYEAWSRVRFTFIDDTYHCGKTRRAVNKALATLGSDIEMTYVFADMSYVPDAAVKGFFTYRTWEGRHDYR